MERGQLRVDEGTAERLSVSVNKRIPASMRLRATFIRLRYLCSCKIDAVAKLMQLRNLCGLAGTNQQLPRLGNRVRGHDLTDDRGFLAVYLEGLECWINGLGVHA